MSFAYFPLVDKVRFLLIHFDQSGDLTNFPVVLATQRVQIRRNSSKFVEIRCLRSLFISFYYHRWVGILRDYLPYSTVRSFHQQVVHKSVR
jgi:hypothetical protein